MTETAEKTEVKKEYGSFLKDKVLEVQPVESSGKWRTLLVKGQDMNNSPFMLNKVKRSFQIPLMSERKGGGVKRILDNNDRVLIRKYENSYPGGMTEREFFEEELGVNLNPNAPKDENFWRKDKRGRVVLTKQGMTLNLNDPMDMLRYKILESNGDLVAPSYEVRKMKQTYEFMFVDRDQQTNKLADEAELTAAAYAKYAEITMSESKMITFMRSQMKSLPANYTEKWLKTEIYKVVQAAPKKFLAIVNDADYQAKAFVQKAVEAGSIKRMNNKRFILDNGQELGDLPNTIKYLKENQELKLRIDSQIEMHFKNK